MAKLTAVYGPMFAGKTTWIIQKISELEKNGQKCLVFKPRLDDRYGKEAKLHSHGGLSEKAILIDENKPEQMLGIWAEKNEQHSVVVIDEAMFFTPDVVDVVKEMIARELEVIVAGLDTNFRREPFGAMPHLIKLADEKEVLRSSCYKCGGVAEYSARLVGGSENIEVGADDVYQPACITCHTVCPESSKDFSFIFPDLRAEREGSGISIEVGADSLRTGKTTAVQVIAEGLSKHGIKIEASYEDWQHNPFLKKSYSDPVKNFLESQKWFVHRKWEQITSSVNKGAYIQDVSPETDYCYAATNLRLSRMSKKDFDEYDAYYRSLDWSKAPKPGLLVYLEVGDKELIRRAQESRREFETVEPDYFLMMKKVNREWLSTIGSKRKVLIVNTDNFDFANDNNAKKELVERVLAALS